METDIQDFEAQIELMGSDLRVVETQKTDPKVAARIRDYKPRIATLASR